MPGLLEDLRWRGLMNDTTDHEALGAALASGPVTFYVGFDPTAPSLHVGHLLQVLTMRRLQEAGHRPIVLVGGATGLIGDPKPAAERSLADRDTAALWAARLRAQMEPFFDFDGPAAATVVDNLEWTESLSALDLLRDVGKHFSVNRMLDRDAVARRLDSSSGISFTEFSYVLLQSNDYLELYRRYGCRLQFGGSDQWGNITAGVDLVRRVEAEHVHAFTTPLLVKADGTKYGKTESGTLWVDPQLTSPYAFYQYWRNVDDADVGMLLRRLTFLDRPSIEALEQVTKESPSRREAQQVLAHEVTALVHGEAQARQAAAAAAALFGLEELRSLEESTLRAALAEAGLVALLRTPMPTATDVLVAAGVVPSRSAARRAVQDGGAYLNNVKVEDADATVPPAALLHGRYVVVRRGRRTVAGVDLGSAES